MDKGRREKKNGIKDLGIGEVAKRNEIRKKGLNKVQKGLKNAKIT